MNIVNALDSVILVENNVFLKKKNGILSLVFSIYAIIFNKYNGKIIIWQPVYLQSILPDAHMFTVDTKLPVIILKYPYHSSVGQIICVVVSFNIPCEDF